MVERRGELSEEETRGLTAERAVAPLVIELECMDELRRGGGFWSADDILWVTLGVLWPVVGACSVARHVYRTSHHDGPGAVSIRIPRSSKNFLHSIQPTRSPSLPVVIERYAVHMLVFFFFNLGNLPCLVLIKHSRRSYWNTYSSVNRTIISVFPSSR